MYIPAFNTGIFQLVYSQQNLLHDFLILLTITNNSLSTKLHPKNSLLIPPENTEHMSNNRG